MSDEPIVRTVPPKASHWRILALIVWGFLALRSIRIWRRFADPLQVHYFGQYLRASVYPGHAWEVKYQALFDLYYHAPLWHVLLPVLVPDLLLLVVLHQLAIRYDMRKIRQLRKGRQISGPVLHPNVNSFQKAINK